MKWLAILATLACATILFINNQPRLSSGEAALRIMQEAEDHGLNFDADGKCHGDKLACGRVGLIRLQYRGAE